MANELIDRVARAILRTWIPEYHDRVILNESDRLRAKVAIEEIIAAIDEQHEPSDVFLRRSVLG